MIGFALIVKLGQGLFCYGKVRNKPELTGIYIGFAGNVWYNDGGSNGEFMGRSKKMSKLWRKPLGKVVAMLMALAMVLSPLTDAGVLKVQAAEISIAESKGYEEGAYAKWTAVSGADSYKAYVSSDGSNYTEIDSAMIRVSGDYYRVDEVGLASGSYTIKVEAWSEGSVIATATTGSLTVTNYDRSGYAHFNYTEGVGAYKDDGTLKDNAIVLYVTDANKDTVSVTSSDGTTVTGIGHILNSTGRDNGSGTNSKGGLPNNNSEIIKIITKDC